MRAIESWNRSRGRDTTGTLISLLKTAIKPTIFICKYNTFNQRVTECEIYYFNDFFDKYDGIYV